MKPSTVGILAAIALSLFGYIVLVERDALTDIETAGRGARLIEDFSRRRVTRIVIEREGEERIVLQRGEAREADPFGLSDDEGYTWNLVSPLDVRASDDAVDSLLGAFEWAEPRRRVQGITEGDRAEYGLTSPALSISLTIADRDVTVRVGGEDPTGAGRYALLNDTDTLYVVGADVTEAIDHDADHFRSRELFPDPFLGMRDLSLSHAGETIELVRTDDTESDETWELRRPYAMLASSQRVRDIRRELGALEATRFVGDDETLGEVFLRLQSRARPAEGADLRDISLVVGAPCGDHEGERFARAGGEEAPLVCVETNALDALVRGADDLRETRPFTAPETDIQAVEIASEGVTLRVEDHDGEWRYERREGGRTQDGEVDPDAFSEWLTGLRGVTTADVEIVDASGMQSRGFDSPRITVTLEGRGEAPTQRFAVGNGDLRGLFVRRGDESVVLIVPDSFGRSARHLSGRVLVPQACSGSRGGPRPRPDRRRRRSNRRARRRRRLSDVPPGRPSGRRQRDARSRTPTRRPRGAPFRLGRGIGRTRSRLPPPHGPVPVSTAPSPAPTKKTMGTDTRTVSRTTTRRHGNISYASGRTPKEARSPVSTIARRSSCSPRSSSRRSPSRSYPPTFSVRLGSISPEPAS